MFAQLEQEFRIVRGGKCEDVAKMCKGGLPHARLLLEPRYDQTRSASDLEHETSSRTGKTSNICPEDQVNNKLRAIKMVDTGMHNDCGPS